MTFLATNLIRWLWNAETFLLFRFRPLFFMGREPVFMPFFQNARPFFYFSEKFSPPQNGEFFESQKDEHFHFSKNSPGETETLFCLKKSLNIAKMVAPEADSSHSGVSFCCGQVWKKFFCFFSKTPIALMRLIRYNIHRYTKTE